MKKIVSVFGAVLASCAVLAGCGKDAPVPGEEAKIQSGEEMQSEAQTETEAEQGEETALLTLEDIRQMNGGDIRYSTDEQGNITFLAGRFYDGKIKDGDDVLHALEGMCGLIGADENVVFKKGDGIVDDNGYTYYTLQQWHGDSAVADAIVKIIVNPNGEAAAISSSVQPGVDAGMDLVISPEEAVEAARAYLEQADPQTSYTFYPEQVEKATIPYEGEEDDYTKFYNVYVIYTDNPALTAEENDYTYLAHYISAEGDYLYGTPVFQIGSEEAKAGGDSQSVFTGKAALTYTGEVTLHDGSTQEVSVPVLYDETDKVYYSNFPHQKWDSHLEKSIL